MYMSSFYSQRHACALTHTRPHVSLGLALKNSDEKAKKKSSVRSVNLLGSKARDTAIIRLELGAGFCKLISWTARNNEPSGLHLLRVLFSLDGGQ